MESLGLSVVLNEPIADGLHILKHAHTPFTRKTKLNFKSTDLHTSYGIASLAQSQAPSRSFGCSQRADRGWPPREGTTTAPPCTAAASPSWKNEQHVRRGVSKEEVK